MAPPSEDRPAVRGVVHRNIAALLEVRRDFQRRKTTQERLADAITAFAGSMWFVYVHAVFYGGWIIFNTRRLSPISPFDPFPFVMLAMIASVEAIFLSTFILISQNRSSELAEKRAELDLQISLLAEHETTRLIHMLDAVARHIKVPLPPSDLEELKQDVRPEQVVEEIERAEDEGMK